MIDAPILYWFPGHLDIPPEYKNQLQGVPHTLTRGSYGPVDGKRGVLVSPHGTVKIAYAPGIQQWDQLGEMWLGANRFVTPENLEREKMFDGKWVTLADNNSWCIPIANPMVKSCSLPIWQRLSPKRIWEKVVQDEFVKLSQRAQEIAEQVIKTAIDGKPEIDLEDEPLRELMAEIIGLNYKVTLEELSVLRVFNDDVLWPVVAAFIDWDTIQVIIRESIEADFFLDTQDTNNSPPGVKDSAPNTGRLAPTSTF